MHSPMNASITNCSTPRESTQSVKLFHFPVLIDYIHPPYQCNKKVPSREGIEGTSYSPIAKNWSLEFMPALPGGFYRTPLLPAQPSGWGAARSAEQTVACNRGLGYFKSMPKTLNCPGLCSLWPCEIELPQTVLLRLLLFLLVHKRASAVSN